MQIVTSQVSDVTVITLAGSLDAASVADFDAEWKAALDGGATKLVVDLGGIEYISSAGLRGILMLSKTARACALYESGGNAFCLHASAL